MTVFTGIAQFERDPIRERTSAGREVARAGIHFGVLESSISSRQNWRVDSSTRDSQSRRLPTPSTFTPRPSIGFQRRRLNKRRNPYPQNHRYRVGGNMRCSKCHGDNREGRKFCRTCGTALVASCPKCGTPVQPRESFCVECGAALGEATPAAAADTARVVASAHGERRHLTGVGGCPTHRRNTLVKMGRS